VDCNRGQMGATADIWYDSCWGTPGTHPAAGLAKIASLLCPTDEGTARGTGEGANDGPNGTLCAKLLGEVLGGEYSVWYSHHMFTNTSGWRVRPWSSTQTCPQAHTFMRAHTQALAARPTPSLPPKQQRYVGASLAVADCIPPAFPP
jgi:hypothetical protein